MQAMTGYKIVAIFLGTAAAGIYLAFQIGLMAIYIDRNP
jgi:hypothetical protein